MSLTSLLVPTYVNMLGALSRWLAKAETQLSPEAAQALPAARLAPDMYPLATQVRFACVQAQEGLHRLAGRAFPDTVGELLNEGRNAGEHPGTLADARERIAQTLALVERMAPGVVEPDADAPLVHDLPNGMTFDVTAERYVRDWAIGQFYFHVMTAYAILRKEGVEIGKADYVGHLLPHMRQPVG